MHESGGFSGEGQEGSDTSHEIKTLQSHAVSSMRRKSEGADRPGAPFQMSRLEDIRGGRQADEASVEALLQLRETVR